MGQKVNPNSFRMGINKDWSTRFFADSNSQWAKWTVEDKKIRKIFEPKFKEWSISSVSTDRTEKEYKILVHSARPGVIIGEDGANTKKIKIEIARIIKDKNTKITLDILETKNIDLDANLIASDIALALENRSPFRIAQKRAISRVMRAGAKGIKTQVSGRLNGVDMARTEGYSEGEVPLQTLRNDIDYAASEALTTYGILGVKVWISKGEIINGKHVSPIEPKFRKRRNDFNKKPRNFNSDSKPEVKKEVKEGDGK